MADAESVLPPPPAPVVPAPEPVSLVPPAPEPDVAALAPRVEQEVNVDFCYESSLAFKFLAARVYFYVLSLRLFVRFPRVFMSSLFTARHFRPMYCLRVSSFFVCFGFLVLSYHRFTVSFGTGAYPLCLIFRFVSLIVSLVCYNFNPLGARFI